jgi:hypothetical protein
MELETCSEGMAWAVGQEGTLCLVAGLQWCYVTHQQLVSASVCLISCMYCACAVDRSVILCRLHNHSSHFNKG